MIKKNTVRYTHNKFKRSTKSWISIEKKDRVIQFNKKDWLKSYIDINT